MKKIMLLFISCLVSIFFIGCTDKEVEDNTLYIEKAVLTEEEDNIIKLLGTEFDNSIFDFKVDDTVKSIYLTYYTLEDGKWIPDLGESKYLFKDTEGRIAITFNNLDNGHREALQSKSVNSSSTHYPEEKNIEEIGVTTSYLSDKKEIVYEEEIPLVIQILTNKNEVKSYNVDYFYSPEVYAEEGYEKVYAITVKFSQNEISDTNSENTDLYKPEATSDKKFIYLNS